MAAQLPGGCRRDAQCHLLRLRYRLISQLLQEARERRRRNRAASRDNEHGRSESSAFADHGERASQERRSRHAEPGIGAPCGPSEQRERAMPEVSLTEPTGRGISDQPRDHNLAAPAILETVRP